MFAGTALSVCLLVYAGLSLFIINGPYVYMVVCVVYAYNLTWGGPKNWQKRGRAKRVLSHFCHLVIKSPGHFRIAPLSLHCFRRFSVLIPPCLFTVHVRPVLSPCQAGNTHYTSTCFWNMCKIYNVINTICALIWYIVWR